MQWKHISLLCCEMQSNALYSKIGWGAVCVVEAAATLLTAPLIGDWLLTNITLLFALIIPIPVYIVITQHIWLNINISFSALFLAQVAGDSPDAAAVVNQVPDINSDAEFVLQSTNSLSTSFYALVGWVALATVALAAIAVITLQRRRRKQQRQLNDEDNYYSDHGRGGDSNTAADDGSLVAIVDDSVGKETETPARTASWTTDFETVPNPADDRRSTASSRSQ